MPRYRVYLEIAPGGLTMAHLPDLPGFLVRAPSPGQALEQVPEAVRSYYAWLRGHGEATPVEEEKAIEIEVAGESSGFGPFESGDAAALFPPDQAAISPEEMEHLFRRMGYSRADLLELVRDLPDGVRDWRPDPHTRTIRQVLRHVGNAEEWYVSRIVSPDTLPAEWEHDEAMPILEFLEMERCTAVERLRGLSQAERSEVFHLTRWTQHPEEPWTARKVLRRFLEHEREHSDEIRERLSLYRRHLLAHLAAARAELLERLVGLQEQLLTKEPACGVWTNQDVLVHIAAWDRWVRRELGHLLAGEAADVSAVRDINGYNAANVAAWRGRSLDEVVAELQQAHTAWTSWLESVAAGEYFQRRSVGRGNWWPPFWIEVFRKHDAEHTHILVAWREGRGRPAGCGPQSVLLATLQACREELLAAISLVPVEERGSRAVCGTWTLRDVLGHLADWEQYALQGLRDMAAGRPPQVEYVTDEEAWNQAQAQKRRDQPWEAVWADFQSTCAALMDVLQGMDSAALARTFPGVWDEETTPYAWALLALVHDREHARDIREAMAGQAGLVEAPTRKRWKSRGE